MVATIVSWFSPKANHDTIVATCPVAWLITLILKVESNLERGRRGLTCARVHAKGCLRDARGYWKSMYVDTRRQVAGEEQGRGDGEDENGREGRGGKLVGDLVSKGEARIAASFRTSIMQEGAVEEGTREGGAEL